MQYILDNAHVFEMAAVGYYDPGRGLCRKGRTSLEPSKPVFVCPGDKGKERETEERKEQEASRGMRDDFNSTKVE